MLEGEKVPVARLVGSIWCQVLPSLLGRVYCWVLAAVWCPEESTSAVNRVGEKADPIGPAPAAMVAPGAGLLVFQTISTV